jgi:mannitol/fructose-specific phosphotransferase system IIA component (Ntr-type)
MKTTEITSSIQLAARLTDSLFREGITNADSAQALFDILADALDKRPDVVAAVAEDLSERQRAKDEFVAEVMARLNKVEQYYQATTNIEVHSSED